MVFDIRLPIGLMFTLVGAMLCGFAVVTGPSTVKGSLGLPVNLWSGAVMLLFGVIMLALTRRKR
jgi:hypothetical protein